MIDVLIRRSQPQERDSVREFVQAVVDDVYGVLWAPAPILVDEEEGVRLGFAQSLGRIGY
jgi:hypothetical protein